MLEFINRKSVSTDRIPQADELELWNFPPSLNLLQGRIVGHPSQSAKPLSTKSVPSGQNVALKLLLGKPRGDQTLI